MDALTSQSSDRRHWLATHARLVGAVVLTGPSVPRARTRAIPLCGMPATGHVVPDCWGTWDDPSDRERLARRGVAAARAAGARYADVRLTRSECHTYDVGAKVEEWDTAKREHLGSVFETLGVGVRVLVDGYWGFAATTVFTPDEIERLVHDAVGQARTNAQSSPAWHVDLGVLPAVTGRWRTPVRIDPFAITIEEKTDYFTYLDQIVRQAGLVFKNGAKLHFAREERVLATSEGTCLTQTCLESGGALKVAMPGLESWVAVHGVDIAGAGWELILDANIPDQFLSGQLADEARARAAIKTKPFTIGKYPLVCDGATMGRVVEATLGLATQLDRALGYEANAVGTSVFGDPLGMVGNFAFAPSSVTLTANRSAPGQLATVAWDDEGVAPVPFPLVTDGVLVDFQTTREQAGWLAPYYQKHGLPVTSHGCAASESAHYITLQQMPNLALEPVAGGPTLEQLVSEVSDGIFLEGAMVYELDSQGKNGLLGASEYDVPLRQIKNGRLGPYLAGGAVYFDSQELWKKVLAVGGEHTAQTVSTTKFLDINDGGMFAFLLTMAQGPKGQPPQRTGRSIRAAAAILPDQPLIDLNRKV